MPEEPLNSNNDDDVLDIAAAAAAGTMTPEDRERADELTARFRTKD